MYIYELEGDFFNENEQEQNYEYEYLVHENEYSKDTFERMCNEGLETILDKTIYELRDYLILNYGFKKLPVKQRFSFEED